MFGSKKRGLAMKENAALKAEIQPPTEAEEEANRAQGLTPEGDEKEPVDPSLMVEREEPRTLLWFALIAAMIAAFVVLARYATGDAPREFDNRILLALRSPDDLSDPIGPHWLLEFARDFTALSGWPVLTVFTLILSIYLAMRRKWGTMLLVLGAVIGESLIVDSIKGLFGRERPIVVPHLVDVGNFSFPSGHSASAAAVYLTFGVIIARASHQHSVRIYVILVAIVMAALIGASRLYLGVHFPSDVAAGLSLGAAWAACVWLAAYYIDHWFGSFWKGTR